MHYEDIVFIGKRIAELKNKQSLKKYITAIISLGAAQSKFNGL